jgi:hypothetical protein
VPVIAVYLAFFLLAALLTFNSIRRQVQASQRYAMSTLLFLFSGERVVACVLRIVWASRQTSVEIAIASQILLQAGVLLLYIGNLLYTGAIIRAGTGQHNWLTVLQITLSILTLTAFFMAVAAIVLEVYTLDQHTIANCRQVLRAAATCFVVLAATPLALIVAAYFSHREQLFQVVQNTWFDAVVTGISSLLCVLTAGFKMSVLWEAPRSLWNPAWYHSKPALYGLELGPEILVLALFLLVHVETRYHCLLARQAEDSEVARTSTLNQPTITLSEVEVLQDTKLDR